MALKFGQTWWGQQWLNAFDGIDFSNRLPRGQRYARNGSVSSIDITVKAVNARVQGTRRTPYKVSIGLNPFTAAQRKIIVRTVQQNPALLSRLLNRQLPAQLLPAAERQGIGLFPDSWQSMAASCSCPDWAVPCKHIAAVIYLIANEIDKNPFLIFTLHGMDLVSELERQTGLRVATLTAPPSTLEGWHTGEASPETAPSCATDPGETTTAARRPLDVSRIPPLQERVFAILTPRPLFHDKDFHAQLAAMTQRMAREAQRFDQQAQVAWPGAERADTLTAVIDDAGRLLALRGDAAWPLASSRETPHGGTAATESKTIALLQALLAIEAAQEPRLSDHLAQWRQICRLALKLLQQTSMIPAVLTTPAGETVIQWRPALMSAPVRAVLKPLYASCPPDLVMLHHDGTDHAAHGRQQVDSALHLLVSAFAEMALTRAPVGLQDDPLHQLFFAAQPQRFTHFETAEHPLLIQHWLSRLSLSEREHQLCLSVTAGDDDPEWLEIAIEIAHQGRSMPLQALFGQSKAPPQLTVVLADLAILADSFPELESLYGDAPEDALRLSLNAFTPVFTGILPALKLLGIQVKLPKALQKLAYPRVNVALSTRASGHQPGYLNLDELLQFDWRIALGEQRLSVDEFRALIQDAEGLVHAHGQYVMLDGQHLQNLLKKLDQLPESLSRFELLKAGLAGELDGASVDLGPDARALFEQMLKAEAVPVPAALQAQLRPYQQRGFEWMVQNARIGFGSLLADDMGLGKTLQVITLLLHQQAHGQLDERKVLVIAPTSLLTNWHKELTRFAPTLAVQVYHGSQRQLQAARHDIVLTSYGLARSDYKVLSRVSWRTLVIDEAQNIKNPGARQTKVIKQYRADIRIAMSGTPVENRLGEYWSLFDFANRDYLATQKQFDKAFARPIEHDHDEQVLARFRKITAPFILRRVKSDPNIISDLPAKIEGNRYCSLTSEQTALYQATVDTLMAELAGGEEGIQRQGLVLKLLNALKQICNSPAQYLDQTRAETAESGKLGAFVEIMRELDATEEKALIFTQYTTMGKLLVDTLNRELGIEVPFLHGGLSRKQRDTLVESFQSDRRVRAMVLSLKAGGTGLNLTAASQVIHYDLWWNPAVEAQATDRAYRIGQQQRVQVHRLITANTLEEKIDRMVQDKKALAEMAVAGDEKWISQLSNQELRELVALGER